MTRKKLGKLSAKSSAIRAGRTPMNKSKVVEKSVGKIDKSTNHKSRPRKSLGLPKDRA